MRAYHFVQNLILAMLCWWVSPLAHALELEFFDGEVSVDIINEINYGVGISMQAANKDYIYGIPAGSSVISFTGAQGDQKQADNGDPVIPLQDQIFTGNGGRSVAGANIDDGRLKYDRYDAYQNQARGFSDIRANWGDFGARVKLMYFYDVEFMRDPGNTHPGTREPVPTLGRAVDAIGRNITTREALVYWDGYFGDVPITIKIGDQVLNWGMAQFAPGINQINALDVQNLLVPALDPANARLPSGIAMINFEPFDGINVEAYYQYERAIIQAPPGGSFFAIADLAGPGVSDFSGLGRICSQTQVDATYDVDPSLGQFGSGAACVPLADPILPSHDGQFGIKIGFTLPFIPLLDQFQFDAYYLRHHARVPNIGVRRAGVIPNAVPCNIVRAVLLQSPDLEGRRYGEALTSATPGMPQTEACLALAPFNQQGWNPDDFVLPGFIFPEDQSILGLSWRGSIPGGFVWATELAYRKDTPIQINPAELLGATAHVSLNSNPAQATDFSQPPFNLTPAQIATLLPGGGTIQTAQSGRESDRLTGDFLQLPRGFNCYEFAGFDPGVCYQEVQNGTVEPDGGPMGYDGTWRIGQSLLGTPIYGGFFRRDVFQMTSNFLKIFPNFLGAERFIFLFELSYMKIFDLPTDIKMARTDLGCNQFLATCVKNPDDWAWGYRMVNFWQFDNFLDTGLQAEFRTIFFHDVKGYVPDNLLLFKEGRKNLITEFSLKWQTLTASVRYLGFTGAHEANTLSDRDSLQFNVKYVY